MKKTKEDAGRTRQAVLTAALKIFADRGYGAASLDAVAKEAGMTRGAIYWHFKNKYELLSAVLQQCYEKSEVRVMRVLDSSLSPLGKVRQLLYEFFMIISEELEHRVMEELLVFKTEKKEELHLLYLEHMENIKRMRELMKGLIREGIELGEFDRRIDPDIVVFAWISYVGGVKTAWLSDITSVSVKDSAESLVDIFIHGIVNKS